MNHITLINWIWLQFSAFYYDDDLLRRLRGAFFRFVGMIMGTWILWVNAWKGHLIKIETQYLLKTSSQQTFPFPPTQYKQFKPFCGIKTYLKYLLWKKKWESCDEPCNKQMHELYFLRGGQFLLSKASYIFGRCEAFTWFECPVGLFEYSITLGTQTMSCRGGFLWERARNIEPVSYMVNNLTMWNMEPGRT